MRGYTRDEKDSPRDNQGRFQILVSSRVPRNEHREENIRENEGKLSQTNMPSVPLKAQVEDELRRDGVDRSKEYPALNGKRECGQSKIGVPGKVCVDKKSIGSPFPFLDEDELINSNSK
jgi:hypothetical protein